MNRIVLFFAAALTLFTAQSCINGGDNQPTYYGEAIFTSRPSDYGGAQVHLQINDTITVIPNNLHKDPFEGKETRAYMSFTTNQTFSKPGEYPVTLTYIYGIVTTNCVEDFGDENLAKYGKDDMIVLPAWETVVEDDYITLHYKLKSGFSGTVEHSINLVQSKENPSNFFIYHDAKEDFPEIERDYLKAFKLPDDQEELLPITLSWISGGKTYSLVFDTDGKPVVEK